MARRFHAVFAQAAQQAGNQAKKGAVSASELQPRMRRAGLRYYADCEVAAYSKKQRQLQNSSDVGIGHVLLGCAHALLSVLRHIIYVSARCDCLEGALPCKH